MITIVATDVKCVDGFVSSERRDERHRTKQLDEWEMVLHVRREWQEQRCWQPSLLELQLLAGLTSFLILANGGHVSCGGCDCARAHTKIYGLSVRRAILNGYMSRLSVQRNLLELNIQSQQPATPLPCRQL